MTKSDIVIGSQLGDEGKGVVVNNLCNPDSVVVRFSGGQQAGHTVIHDGVKHIFSSFGAGTLKGCPTFFTEDTTFYLPNLQQEYNVLLSKGVDDPLLILHPLCKATTPFDIAYNRAKTTFMRDGTCGLGVGATMSRDTFSGHKLYAIDFLNKRVLLEKLNLIHAYYKRKAMDEGFRNAYLEESSNQYEIFLSYIQQRFGFRVGSLPSVDHYVFEGSQGILLDMDHGFFPNVTFANTTSKNAIKYCKGETSVYYVSRCYGTRHGNGYVPNETPVNLINTEEEINVNNEFQGPFRTFEIDFDLIRYAIDVDAIYSGNVDKNIVFTCLDQRENFEIVGPRFHGVRILRNFGPESGKMV